MLVFEKLEALNNEEGIDAILAHLVKLNLPVKSHVFNLLKHVESISERYEETLKKLAQ